MIFKLDTQKMISDSCLGLRNHFLNTELEDYSSTLTLLLLSLAVLKFYVYSITCATALII